jgi:hypothetical protein
MTEALRRLARVCRRHAGRRWAVVVVIPAANIDGVAFPRIDMPLEKNLTRAEADARLSVLESNCLSDDVGVRRAVLEDGAWLEVAELDRWGFVRG